MMLNTNKILFAKIASLTAAVASSIPTWSHTLRDIDHEIISMVILLLPLIQEGLSVTKIKYRSAGQLLSQACPGKSVAR